MVGRALRSAIRLAFLVASCACRFLAPLLAVEGGGAPFLGAHPCGFLAAVLIQAGSGQHCPRHAEDAGELLRRSVADASAPVFDREVAVVGDMDRDRAGVAGDIGGIERVVGQFLDDQPRQPVHGHAGLLRQAGEAGVERSVRAFKK